MANRRSSIKKIRVDIRRRVNNVQVLSELKTTLRKTSKVLLEKKPAEIAKQASALFSKIDKAVKKKILHANRAGRLKSRFQKKINLLKTAK